MQLINGIQATIKMQGDRTEPTETDVRTILFAAIPVLFGMGTEIEQIDGPDWLVTLPCDLWAAIQETGYFEFGAKLDAHRWMRIHIEADTE